MADVSMDQVNQARDYANQVGQTALQWGSQGQTLADELRKAVGERFGESGVAQEAATNRSNYLAAGPQARSDVAGLVSSGAIMSPSQQQAILTAKRAAALVPVMSSNVLQQAQFGTLEDLINAGVNAWNKQATYSQGMAGLAQNNYSNLLDQLKTQSQIEQAQKPSTTIWEDSSGHSWLINSVTGEKLQDLGATYHTGTTKEPDKYPYSSPYIETGLAGQLVSQVGNKVVADYIARTGQGASKQAAADLAYKQAQTEALQAKSQPGILESIWNWINPVKPVQ